MSLTPGFSSLVGSRASTNASPQQQQSVMYNKQQPSSSARKGTAMEQYRKISSEMQTAEADIIGRLRREAAERSDVSDGFTSPIDPEFYMDETPSERQRKRSYLGRVDEYSTHSRPVTQRSISKELYEPDRSSTRHVTRRSVSRELHEPSYNPSWAPSPNDYSRSSRERSLGRDTNFDSLAELERRINNRRSESLSRPSLASQGRSLTQSELGSTSSRRLSSGMRSPITVQDPDDYMSSSRLGGGGTSSSNSTSNRYSTLDDRSRADWRRVSVPERGKDFKSLSKYNR